MRFVPTYYFCMIHVSIGSQTVDYTFIDYVLLSDHFNNDVGTITFASSPQITLYL